MFRKQNSIKKTNKIYKKGMKTHVKNLPARPSRGGIRL